MTRGMILARLAFIMRAYKARVGPLDTMSIIPIRSFFMNPTCQRTSLLLCASRRVNANGGGYLPQWSRRPNPAGR
jgi:hypothetical protein